MVGDVYTKVFGSWYFSHTFCREVSAFVLFSECCTSKYIEEFDVVPYAVHDWGCLGPVKEELILDGVDIFIDESIIGEELDSIPTADVGGFVIGKYKEK